MDNKVIRKEQCPQCATKGRDNSKDNLAVYDDGQTHCFSCGDHGFVEHTNKKAIQIKERIQMIVGYTNTEEITYLCPTGNSEVRHLRSIKLSVRRTLKEM